MGFTPEIAPEHARLVPDSLSPLQTALALSVLNDLPERTQDMENAREQLFELLISRRKGWFFSPDPLVQFVALAATAAYRPDSMDGTSLSSLTEYLISLELQPGGPYRLPSHFPDPAINAAIAMILHRQGVQLPELDAYFEQAIASEQFLSRYVPTAFVVYLLASVCPDASKSVLKNWLMREKSTLVKQGVVPAAWVTTAFLRLGHPASELQEETAFLRNDSGISSDDHPLFLREDGTQEIAAPLHGLFVLEALSGLEAAAHASVADKPLMQSEESMLRRIFDRGQTRFAALASELRENALAQIDRTLKGNTDRQMALMSYYMREALGTKGSVFSDDRIAALGLANVYFWTAFIIYDNFWDEDEEAIPSILPTANLYTREFVSFFKDTLPEHADFQHFTQQLMDRLDGANTWETVRCRAHIRDGAFIVPDSLPSFGDYERKYEPASAHVLGPVSMLCELGYTMDSSEMQHLLSYFRNYLVPMQINDDLHDWEEDLERGHVSTVVALLLEDLGAKPGDAIHPQRDLKELKQTFWFKTLPRGCAIMRPYLEKSRQSLQSMSSLERKAPLERFITRIETSVAEAEREQRLSSEFLAAFSKPESTRSSG